MTDGRLMSSREAVWPVVKQLDVAQSGRLSQQKVCHRRAGLMHRASVASMSPCCIQASWFALTVTVCTSHVLSSHKYSIWATVKGLARPWAKQACGQPLQWGSTLVTNSCLILKTVFFSSSNDPESTREWQETEIQKHKHFVYFQGLIQLAELLLLEWRLKQTVWLKTTPRAEISCYQIFAHIYC